MTGTLTLWSGRSDGQSCAVDLDVLSAEEQRRFSAFHDPVRAAHFAAAHAQVRRHLGWLLGMEPWEIRFARHPCAGCGRVRHGRPYIQYPETTWEFSLSRCGPRWLCAAANGIRVGVDLERVRATDHGTLAAGVLSEHEREHLRGAARESRNTEFMRCWTRKEAVVKASGIGVEADLRTVDVQPWSRIAKVNHRVPGHDIGAWLVLDLPPVEDYCSAFAVQSTPQSIQELSLLFGGEESVHPTG